jgi:hypothetical protein
VKPVSSSFARVAALALCLSASACVMLNSASISESSGGASGTAVTTEYSDYGILHLTRPETLTANANTALMSKCQTGMVSGVSTELSTREWFLIQYYTVNAAGTCK